MNVCYSLRRAVQKAYPKIEIELRSNKASVEDQVFWDKLPKGFADEDMVNMEKDFEKLEASGNRMDRHVDKVKELLGELDELMDGHAFVPAVGAVDLADNTVEGAVVKQGIDVLIEDADLFDDKNELQRL